MHKVIKWWSLYRAVTCAWSHFLFVAILHSLALSAHHSSRRATSANAHSQLRDPDQLITMMSSCKMAMRVLCRRASEWQMDDHRICCLHAALSNGRAREPTPTGDRRKSERTVPFFSGCVATSFYFHFFFSARFMSFNTILYDL